MDILRTTATGALLLKQLDSSQFTVRIKEGAESRISADYDRAATDGTGSASVLRHNPTATPLAPTASGPLPTPPHVVLGHELAHAVDISKGELNTRRSEHTGVLRSEERAVQIENLIRRELGGVRVGLPDRTGCRLEQ
jgi:NleD-like pathogen effector protein (putative zinc metallopeptidase)